MFALVSHLICFVLVYKKILKMLRHPEGGRELSNQLYISPILPSGYGPNLTIMGINTYCFKIYFHLSMVCCKLGLPGHCSDLHISCPCLDQLQHWVILIVHPYLSITATGHWMQHKCEIICPCIFLQRTYWVGGSVQMFQKYPLFLSYSEPNSLVWTIKHSPFVLFGY